MTAAAVDPKVGRFVWHELMTTDPEAARSFYTKVVGWSAAPFEGSDPPYALWMTGEIGQGGLMELPENARKQGAPPHWLTYIAVADVDRAVERVKALGGGVLVPAQDIANVGRFAVVTDPQGAAFAVFRGEGSAPESDPQPGSFSWHELTTSDAQAAWRFYAEVFRWTETDAMDLGGGETYRMFGYGEGTSVGGMSRRAGAPPNWLPYVLVADLDGVVRRIQSLGGTVMLEPMAVPGGDRIAIASDAQGAVLGYHELPR